MIFHNIIKMKIIIVLVLGIFYYPKLTTQDGAEVRNQIICGISGAVWRSTYVFDISQLPKPCSIILIGQYAFDSESGTDTHMMKSDEGIVKSLVEANIPVYICVGFEHHDDWYSVFNQPDKDVLQRTILDPLVNFLNTYKVNGIIFKFTSIYDVKIDDFENKICDFASNIKTKVNDLKVGLVTSGSNYENFTNDKLFDFTITNKVLDLYIINWSGLNICDKDAVKFGISPVNSDIPNMVTVEQVTSGVTNSSMDKSKIYAMIQMVPVIPDNLLTKDAKYSITTYSTYCSSKDKANSSHWCTNPSCLSYDQGAHAKKFYHGIVLETLDTDDYEDCCQCGKFSVTRTIIDGWWESPYQSCPKLDFK